MSGGGCGCGCGRREMEGCVNRRNEEAEGRDRTRWREKEKKKGGERMEGTEGERKRGWDKKRTDQSDRIVSRHQPRQGGKKMTGMGKEGEKSKQRQENGLRKKVVCILFSHNHQMKKKKIGSK